MIAAMGVLLASCQPAAETEQKKTPEIANEHGQIFTPVQTSLPDLDSILHASVSGMVAVRKSVILNTDSTGSEYQVKDPDREIEALTVLKDLNKPIFRDRYVEANISDAYSNLSIRRIKSIDSISMVRRLDISYLPSDKRIRRISAETVRSNYLFDKREWIEIDFDQDQRRMKSFAVSGSQKVMGFAADQYHVMVTFDYK